MLVYRVAHLKNQHQTLSGIGAEKVGGRWNEVGTRAVYCSENVSLALLEYHVHAVNSKILPREILLAEIHIPDHFGIEEVVSLPEEWGRYPYSPKTTTLFSRRLLGPEFFGLKVPSTVVGVEHNYVLNPMFHGFSEVKIQEFIRLPVDSRLGSVL